jgi:ketosteroid isomerase-like protein
VADRDFSQVSAKLQEQLQAVRGGSASRDAKPLVRSVQAQIDAIARGDFESVLAQALPTVTLEIFAPAEFVWIRRAEGLEEFRRALEHNFGSIQDQRAQLTNVFTEVNTVVLFGREQGRIRATGQPYDMEFVHKFTFQDDRLSSVRIVAAHATAPPPAASAV